MAEEQNATGETGSAADSAASGGRLTSVGWLGAAALAVLFVLLRWNSFDAPLTRDEGEYAYAAQLLLNGRAPYEDSFLQKPPMVAYTYAAAKWIAPDTFWAPRILAFVFAALATVLTGFCIRKEFGIGMAFPTMWLLTPMLLLPGIEQFIANTEMFMVLPLMGTVAVYVHARHGGGGVAHWLAAGALAALTIGYKYTAAPMLAVVFTVWTIEEWRRKRSIQAIATRWGLALVGAVVIGAAVFGYFLARDGGQHLWECTVEFNRYYATGAGFGLDGLLGRLGQFFGAWWFMFLIPCFLFYQRERRVWFWAALFVTAWLCAAGSPFGHYYIPVMPFWAILAAVAVRKIATWAAPRFSQPERWLNFAGVGLAVVMLQYSDKDWLTMSREEFAVRKLSPWGGALESPAVAAQLARMTQPTETIYVAGSEPQILCYANRFSATRFDIAFPLMIPTPLMKRYQAEVISDLEKHPPAAIVMVRGGAPGEIMEFLGKLVAEKYELAGGYMVDAGKGRWQEPLTREDTAKCTMMVFKRRGGQ